MKSYHLFLCLCLYLYKGQAFAQDSAIYKCNVRHITRYPHCDSLRMYNLVQPKTNFRKMLRRDKKVIDFLNLYHTDTLSLNTLLHQLSKVESYGKKDYSHGDTVRRQIILYENGLVKLLIWFEYKGETLLRRYYDLDINNSTGGSFSYPLDYHYKIFKLLNFCLGFRFSCYNFEEEF